MRILSWNIQFAAGREQLFFYDGGDAVNVEAPTVRRTLAGIARVIRDAQPDLVLLQEVDRGSDRTARIDQHAALSEALALPCHLSTPYYRSPYVPYPTHAHLGRMDMHLSVFSRWRVDGAVRTALPTLRESWLRRQFNLRRAVLQVDLPWGDGALRVFQTHLSAFSRRDGTVPRQVAALTRQLRDADRDGVPWVLAGDFNCLPPGDDPTRLGPAAALYAERSTPLHPLFDHWTSAVPATAHDAEPQRWRTWLPHGANEAERALDHVFVGPRMRVLRTEVLSDVTGLSDHLPMLVEVTRE